MSVNLTRVGWEDGTLVTPARVTTPQGTFDVTEATYSGATPLSAQNLKAMENNTEEALNELNYDTKQNDGQGKGYSAKFINDELLDSTDISSLITKNSSKVGTIYYLSAYRKGSRCYLSAGFDLLSEGSNLFTLDSSIKSKYREIGTGTNHQSGSSVPMIVGINANGNTIDSNVYASSVKTYASIHLEWEIA